MSIVRILLAPLIVGFLFLFFNKVIMSAEIVDVHAEKYKSHLLVKHFPFTDRGKLKWWEDNRIMLKEKYNIPQPYESGRYSITVWDIGDGYLEEKPRENTFFPSHDVDYLFCFDDMKVKKNCVDKENWLMDISQNREGDLYIDVKGATYRQTENGFEKLKKASTVYK